MKKLIRLNQQDIHKIVKKVIKEQEEIRKFRNYAVEELKGLHTHIK